jgi:hypothetical protein
MVKSKRFGRKWPRWHILKYYSRIRKLIARRKIYIEKLIVFHQVKESPCPVEPIVQNRFHTSMTLELIMSKPNDS